MSAMDKISLSSGVDSCNDVGSEPISRAKADLPSKSSEIKMAASTGWGGARPGAGRKPSQRFIQRATGPRWYVFEMMRGQEDRIVRELLEGEDRPGYIARPSFHVCQPRIAVEVFRKGKRQVVHQNMFAGYAFAFLDHRRDPWPLIREVDGVLRIFTTNSVNPETGNVTPIPLPVGFVEALIDTAPERLKLAAVRLPSYEPGQALRVETGPFVGHPARCIECDGLTTRVGVTFFGRDIEIIMARGGLSAASQQVSSG
jgi:transcription antitermination factor NusG